MTKVVLTPTSSHTGSGVNVAGASSVLSIINAAATTAVSPTAGGGTSASALASPSRAHLEFTIVGPANSFGTATFMAMTTGGRFSSLVTLNISSNGPKLASQDVTLPAGTTSIAVNVDSLISGVGAVPSASVTY